MASRSLLPVLFALASAFAAGCGVSPQPSPPDLIDLDGDRIGLTPGIELLASVIGFEAAPGTVDPPEGVVLVTNLDQTDAPSTAAVQADGSFAIAVPGASGQRFRFQAKGPKGRSEPFDIEVSSSGGAVDTAAVDLACLVLVPSAWVALAGTGDSRSILLHNECAGAVAIAAPRLRRGRAGFAFAPASPIDLAPGEVATMTVFAGGGSEVEDVLLFDVTAPTAARRAVTLTVPDP